MPPTHCIFQASRSAFRPPRRAPLSLRLKSPMKVAKSIPAGALRGSKFRSIDSAVWVTDSFCPRAESTITSMSCTNQSTSKNEVIGAQAPVLWFTTSIVDAPQSGWQEQQSPPKSAAGPRRWSASDVNQVMAPRGNQSRYGSMRPSKWFARSCARCERVYRRLARSSSEMSSSRPVNDTGWNEIPPNFSE